MTKVTNNSKADKTVYMVFMSRKLSDFMSISESQITVPKNCINGIFSRSKILFVELIPFDKFLRVLKLY